MIFEWQIKGEVFYDLFASFAWYALLIGAFCSQSWSEKIIFGI